jgi:AcrR family transcriptional regulator
MYVIPKDSRQRYTKECLFNAFLHALEAKPVSAITVTSVSIEAGVSRKTFYKYYKDPFALLDAMQEDLYVGFSQEIEDLPPNISEIMPVLLRFVSEHRVLIRAVFANRSEGNFIDRVIAELYDIYHESWEVDNSQMSKKDVEFLFHYVVSGLTGLIRCWLFDNPELSVEEVIEKAEFMIRITKPN